MTNRDSLAFLREGIILHRSLQSKRRFLFPDGQTRGDGGDSIGTWEFPVLLKYRLSLGKVQPFVEIGPSFRTRKNPIATDPSSYGTTVGLGAEFRMERLRIAPAVRYTRWAFDGYFPRVPTNRDQVELLTGISYATSPESWKVNSKKFRLGLVAGTRLTNGFEQPPFFPPISESTGYVAGLMVEVELDRQLSLEVDALYRPLRAHELFDIGNGKIQREPFSVLTWQFPVIAKYRLPARTRFQPFIEAGPSFRLSGNLNGYNPSHFGFTAGAGVEAQLCGLRIAPGARYTHWAVDGNPYALAPRTFRYPHTRPNQVELLVGFSF